MGLILRRGGGGGGAWGRLGDYHNIIIILSGTPQEGTPFHWGGSRQVQGLKNVNMLMLKLIIILLLPGHMYTDWTPFEME